VDALRAANAIVLGGRYGIIFLYAETAKMAIDAYQIDSGLLWGQSNYFESGGDWGIAMSSYQIRLLETRMTTDDTDDVALFSVTRDEDGKTWQVCVFLSPLFRWSLMEHQAPVEARREMVAGLGARAISERLRQGHEPEEQEFLVLATDYPGAPGDPDPLVPYDHVTVRTDEVRTEASLQE